MPSTLPGLAPSLWNEQINNSLFKWLLLKTASRLTLSISPATPRVYGIYLCISHSAKGMEEVSKDLLAATYINCPCAGNPDKWYPDRTLHVLMEPACLVVERLPVTEWKKYICT